MRQEIARARPGMAGTNRNGFSTGVEIKADSASAIFDSHYLRLEESEYSYPIWFYGGGWVRQPTVSRAPFVNNLWRSDTVLTADVNMLLRNV